MSDKMNGCSDHEMQNYSCLDHSVQSQLRYSTVVYSVFPYSCLIISTILYEPLCSIHNKDSIDALRINITCCHIDEFYICKSQQEEQVPS